MLQPVATEQSATSPVPQHQFECRTCGAVLGVYGYERSTVCPYCDSPAVLERPPSMVASPRFALGFVLPKERADELARRWIRKQHFARNDFLRAPIDKTRGVYLPAYLYGGVAHSRYRVNIGENYTETETYTTVDAQGRTVVRTRVVTKTEWRRLSGEYACYVRDVVVTASRSLPNDQLERIEPFDLRALRRYCASIVSGWQAEEPSLAPTDCGQLARAEALAKVGALLGRFMPGDTHQGLEHSTRIDSESLDLVLLPIWVFAVRYHPDKPPARVLVNGQTGKVSGEVPRSMVKIALAVGASLLLVAFALLLLLGAA